MTKPVQHYLNDTDIQPDQLYALIQRAIALKAEHARGTVNQSMRGKVLAMLFDKPSTRTRVSFEAGMIQLGGGALHMQWNDLQVARGEPIADTARVLSGMVDAVVMRIGSQEQMAHFADYADVPTINGLSDLLHPCQLLADMQTWYELRGDMRGKTVAWIGDGNNVCNSYIHTAKMLDFQLRIAHPDGLAPDADVLRAAGDHVEVMQDPIRACTDADLVTTDVWASMGQEAEHKARTQLLAPFQVNTQLLAHAKADAIFLHCLPARRGEEVTAEVMDGPQCAVWQQAANRLHAQKALLEMLILKRD